MSGVGDQPGPEHTERDAARRSPTAEPHEVSTSGDLEQFSTQRLVDVLAGSPRAGARIGRRGVGATLVLQRTIGNQAVQRLLSRSVATGGLAKKLGGEEELAKGVDGEEELQRNTADVVVETRLSEPGMHPSGATHVPSAVELLSKASVSVNSGASPSIGLGAGMYGLTYPERVNVSISAKQDKAAGTWSPKVTALTGRYSMQADLLPGQTEITGPGKNTTSANFCAQCQNLASLGNTIGNVWYMKYAVVKHEQVHASRFKPGLVAASAAITAAIEATSVPTLPKMTEAAAIKQLQGDPAFQAAVTAAQATWLAEILKLVAGDHAAGGPTDQAEKKVVEPLRIWICAHAKQKKWGACPHC